MNIYDVLTREGLKKGSEANAVAQMLVHVGGEIEHLAEFKMRTARYIAYIVVHKLDGPEVLVGIERHATRTLKEVTDLAEGTGGLYNHTFKWNDLNSESTPNVQWSYVDKLRHPLVAAFVFRNPISLGELKGDIHGETA